MIKQFIAIIFLISAANGAWAESYIFSAPPTDNRQISNQIYQPIAQLLSEITGESVVYDYPENWPIFIRNMQQAQYDFLLDAPHFVSWREEKIEHEPLVSLSENLVYVVAVLARSKYQSLSGLRGEPVCSSSLPNLDTLTLLDQYATTSQPVIKNVRGFDSRHAALLAGRCNAMVMPEKAYSRLSSENQNPAMRVIFKSYTLPHYSLSASPKIPKLIKEDIQSALTSSEALVAFSEIDRKFGLRSAEDRKKIVADPDLYRGFTYLLADFWGF